MLQQRYLSIQIWAQLHGLSHKVADVVLLVNKDQLKANLDDTNSAEFDALTRVAAAKASVGTVAEVTKTAGDVSATANAIDSAVKAAVKTTTGVTVTTDAASVYKADETGTYTVTITIKDGTITSVEDKVEVKVVVK